MRSRARLGWDITEVWHRLEVLHASLRSAGRPRAAVPTVGLVQARPLLDGHFRRGFEQAARVGVLRALGDLLGLADFHNLAAIHHSDARRKIAHDRHGVRDEQIRQAEVALQLGEQVDDLRADADVEGGDRFVGHDEFGTQREGAGDADALALSSAEFVGEALQDGFVEADGAQEFDDAGADPGFRRFCFRE